MPRMSAKKQQKPLDSPPLEAQTPKQPDPQPISKAETSGWVPEGFEPDVPRAETVEWIPVGPPRPIPIKQEAERETPSAPPVDPTPIPETHKTRSKRENTVIDRINALTSWEGIHVYVYRHGPMINKIGNHMVKKYITPFDEDDILKDRGLGSGVYEFLVNYQDPKTRKRGLIDSGKLAIINMQYPPRIPKGEWIDDPQNQELWGWVKTVIDQEELAKNPPATKLEANPWEEIIKEELKASREDSKLLREQMNALMNRKPSEEDSLMKTVLATVLPIVAQKFVQDPKPDPSQALLMQYLMKQLEAKNETAAPKTAAEQLEAQIELQKKLDEVYGGRGAERTHSRKSGTQELISDIAQYLGQPLADALKPVLQVVAAGMVQSQLQAQQQQRMNPGGMPQPQMQQTPPPQVPELVEAPQPTPAPTRMTVVPPRVDNRPLIADIAEAALRHLRNGQSGFEFGDWYQETYGEEEFRQARLQGMAQIRKDLESTHLWPQFEQFDVDHLLEDFVTWEAAEDEDEEDDEDALDKMREWAKPVREEVPVA
jgi:hypothetical protein